MILINENGDEYLNPDILELRRHLSRVGIHNNCFAILSHTDQRFIQTEGTRSNGFSIEYRENSAGDHYRSRRSDIPHQDMVNVFCAYMQNNNWAGSIEWNKLTDEKSISNESNRKKLSTSHKILFLIFFIIGLISVSTGCYLAYRNIQFLHASIETDGTVEEIIRRGDTFTPIVTYVDKKGVKQRLHTSHGGTLPSFFAGQHVDVIYNPDDPKFPLYAKIKTIQEVWGGIIFAVIFGLIFMGVSGLSFLFIRKS